MAKIYLGDSVYAELELGMIRLSTNNGDGDGNVIYLDQETVKALQDYIRIVEEGPSGT